MCNKIHDPVITGNNLVKSIEPVKTLGITFQKDLRCNSHVNDIKNKASGSMRNDEIFHYKLKLCTVIGPYYGLRFFDSHHPTICICTKKYRLITI